MIEIWEILIAKLKEYWRIGRLLCEDRIFSLGS